MVVLSRRGSVNDPRRESNVANFTGCKLFESCGSFGFGTTNPAPGRCAQKSDEFERFDTETALGCN